MFSRHIGLVIVPVLERPRIKAELPPIPTAPTPTARATVARNTLELRGWNHCRTPPTKTGQSTSVDSGRSPNVGGLCAARKSPGLPFHQGIWSSPDLSIGRDTTFLSSLPIAGLVVGYWRRLRLQSERAKERASTTDEAPVCVPFSVARVLLLFAS
jgi:hypothetical protein